MILLAIRHIKVSIPNGGHEEVLTLYVIPSYYLIVYSEWH